MIDTFDRLCDFTDRVALDNAKRRLTTLTKPELIALWEHYTKIKLYPNEHKSFTKADLVVEITPYLVDSEEN